MNKKQIANLIMAAVIAVIILAGVLTVGYIRGWFDSVDESSALLTDIRGNVKLLRDGVFYPAAQDTVLRIGDQITCDPGATAVIRMGDSRLVLGQQAALTVTETVAFTVTAGEIFADTAQAVALRFGDRTVTIDQAVALLRAGGEVSVSVLAGTVENTAAGQQLRWDGNTPVVETLQLESLSEFALARIRETNENKPLCFINADLDALEEDRRQEIEDILNGATKPTEPAPDNTVPPATETVPPETHPSETEPSVTEPQPTDPEPTEPAQPTQPSPTEPEPTKPTEPEPTTQLTEPETQPTTSPTEPEPDPTDPAPDFAGYCTLTIRCDAILENYEDLNPGKAEFVPADGEILPEVEIGFYKGETVFDVLKRACDTLGIQLEYSWTPIYNSYYIEGINNLYEKDCGPESGWTYSVNDLSPNYGCSSYALDNGDMIVWSYTCSAETGW